MTSCHSPSRSLLSLGVTGGDGVFRIALLGIIYGTGATRDTLLRGEAVAPGVGDWLLSPAGDVVPESENPLSEGDRLP